MIDRAATSAESETSGRPKDGVVPSGAQTLGVKILAYAAGAVVSVLVARALGPQERGAWSLALLLALILAQLADGGLSTSALYLMRHRPGRVRAAVFMSTAMVLLVSVALGLLLASSIGMRVLPFLDSRPELTVVVRLAIPVLALLALTRALLTALGDLPGANASVLGQSLLLPGVLAITLVAGPPVAVRALWGYLGVTTGMLLLTWLRLLRRVPAGPAWDTQILGTLLRLGAVSQLGSLSLTLTYRSDLLLVGHWLGVGSAGVYSIGLTLSEMLRGVPETGQAVVVSGAARRDLPAYTSRVGRMTVLVTAASGLVMALAAPFVVPLVFGEAYRAAAVVLVCLVPGLLGLAVSYSISPLLFLEGKVKVSALGAVAALAVLWAAALYAPMEMGLPKVALASSLAYWTLAGIQLGYLASRGSIDPHALVPGIHEIRYMLGVFDRRGGWAPR